MMVACRMYVYIDVNRWTCGPGLVRVLHVTLFFVWRWNPLWSQFGLELPSSCLSLSSARITSLNHYAHCVCLCMRLHRYTCVQVEVKGTLGVILQALSTSKKYFLIFYFSLCVCVCGEAEREREKEYGTRAVNTSKSPERDAKFWTLDLTIKQQVFFNRGTHPPYTFKYILLETELSNYLSLCYVGEVMFKCKVGSVFSSNKK